MVEKKRNIKHGDLRKLAWILLIIVLANLISSFWFKRADLTHDRRYTLKKATKSLIKEIDQPIYFKIYLDGNLPSGLKKLQQSTKEMLEEFSAYNRKIKYEFIDIYAITDEQSRRALVTELSQKGIQATNLEVKEKDGVSRRMIFPAGEVIGYQKNETVELLQSQLFRSSEDALNISLQSLEYQLSSAIYKLLIKEKKKIVFLDGHGELAPQQTVEAAFSLAGFYDIDRTYLNDSPERLLSFDSAQKKVLPKYDVAVLAKPQKAFSEIDRWSIDQFVMHGGKLLWLLDATNASVDTLRAYNSQVAIPLDLQLSDLLFKYGLRLNHNLLMDLHAASVPLITGYFQDQPQTEFFPFYYFPLILSYLEHPIVKNLNAIRSEFISTLDTIENDIEKTILLTSSPYSKLSFPPTLINFDILREKPDERAYRQKPQPVAVLLEGTFESAFKHKLSYGLEKLALPFTADGVENRMIVISDGDMIKNAFNEAQGYPYPLGYDPYTNSTYGNKDFIMNCIMYLADGSELLSLRAKNIELKQLDKQKIDKERQKWQLINLGLPLLFVLSIAIAWHFYRKHKYH